MSVIALARIRIIFASPLRPTSGVETIGRRLGLDGELGVLQYARSVAENLLGGPQETSEDKKSA